MTSSQISLPSAPSIAASRATDRTWVWDAPLRLFHWLLVAAVAVAIVSGEVGGEWMAWHGRSGLFIVGLLVFRILWGIVGSAHARFVQFLPTPSRLRAYLRGEWRGQGHNPLGALSVLALISLLGWQAGTGLFGNDEIAFTGPLSNLVDEGLSARLTHWHQQTVWLLFALLGLHVAAIAYHRWVRKKDLVRPMVTGWKPVDISDGLPQDEHRARDAVRVRAWALLLSLALAVGAVWGIDRAGSRADAPEARPAAAPAEGTAASSPW